MNKALSYIGLSKKAGKLTQGTELTLEAVRAGKVKLAVIAQDASENTVKRISNCCKFRGVKYVLSGLKMADLARITGKSGEVAAVGLTDKGLADAVEASFMTQDQT